MASFDPARTAVPEWACSLDERGLASFHEWEMARAPLRRLADAGLAAGGVLPGSRAELFVPGGDEPRPRGGRRW